MAADFKGLLSKKVDDAKRPPLLPAGDYPGVVKGWKPDEVDYKQGDGPVPVVNFNVAITGIGEGMDPEDFKDAEGKEFSPDGRRFTVAFSLKSEEDYRLSEFLQSCGIETEGRSFGETLPDTANAPIFITVIHKQGKPGSANAGETFANVQKIVGQAGAYD